MKTVLEFDSNGDLHGLWGEDVDLYEVGTIHDVRRASHVKFDEAQQEWCVIHAGTGQIVHRDKSRSRAIEWEIGHFSPGCEFYHGQKSWIE